MTSSSRKRLTAWLGLAAMWLAICMPIVSQGLAAHRAGEARVLDAAFCTVDGATHASSAMLVAATAHGHDNATHGAGMSHAAHESQGDLCGYCSLLANHPPLVMPALAGAISFAWIARAGPVANAVPSNTQLAYTPPARAPPAVS
ncbi:DUF2946 domain-containing protein [Pandoraea sputorum]|uniref:DUF2946 domain-containing protein n=1 Tax=Pandoraea sputorum TaxID=93222 RepID=UPI001E334754|nr:DUF2946 domain-containing protein [Pandoraea sputorum]MCE4059478.1 DUF2946 domain-containing protein [Pandoraea sputorum]